jgi:hypothetical protein
MMFERLVAYPIRFLEEHSFHCPVVGPFFLIAVWEADSGGG